jgi:trehalose 6-phosphate phosphatase
VSPAATLLQPLRANPLRSAVLLDIDGTLAPIVRHAEDAHVPEATRTVLIEIAKRYGIVACVSGRRASTARQIVAIGSIAYVGNHGGELLRPGATKASVAPEMASWTERVQRFAAAAYTQELMRLRVRVEDKGAIVALHWRGVPDEDAASEEIADVARHAEQQGFAVHWGRKVLEVRPPVRFDKSAGIDQLLRAADPVSGEQIAAAMYVGDDVTDLDAFRGLREMTTAGRLRTAICVAVASEEAPLGLVEQSDLVVEGQNGVRHLLEALL